MYPTTYYVCLFRYNVWRKEFSHFLWRSLSYYVGSSDSRLMKIIVADGWGNGRVAEKFLIPGTIITFLVR